MRILWIEFENLQTGLKINKISFNKDVTLLVGLSGVGKTQILNAIEYSLKLAVNKDIQLRPYAVTISFEIENEVYEWQYKIDVAPAEDIIESKETKYIFAYERLSNKKGTIMLKDGSKIQVLGYEKVPTPKSDESLLVQYSEDESIRPIINGLTKLYPIEIDMDVRGAIDRESFNMFKTKIKESMQKVPTTRFERFSHLPVPLKIYIAQKYYPHIYTKIFSAIKELFMEITDLKIV